MQLPSGWVDWKPAEGALGPQGKTAFCAFYDGTGAGGEDVDGTWAASACQEQHAALCEWPDRGAPRDKSDCHFRTTATEYDSKPSIKWLSCSAK
jgi:hypothetical protein